jgi:ferredoxin
MSENVYRDLARRLDTIPAGFPATATGVELELLARLVSPEEANLARVMRLEPDRPADIAARAGVDLDTACRLLSSLDRKGLVDSHERHGHRTYRLEARLFGPPAQQLIARDVELARLAEQYYRETRGISIAHAPPPHRVIPVQEAIPFNLEIHHREQVVTSIERARSWAVRACVCRLWQRTAGAGCDHPLETCLMLSVRKNAFDASEIDRPISKQEALDILREAEEAGLVHTVANYGRKVGYICSCCTCCCTILRGVAELSLPAAMARSAFHAAVQTERCVGRGECIDRCQFGALQTRDDVVVVDAGRCVGCGLCAAACSAGALRLERRPAGESPVIPSGFGEWMARFDEDRGMSPADTP